MKNLQLNILCMLLALAAIVSACTKNEVISGDLQGTTADVELRLQIKDETSTKAENVLQNVHIWVYDMSQDNDDRLPVAYKYINSFTSSNSARINVPVKDTERTYRFFAVANYQGLGVIYNTTSSISSTELVLDKNITYKELSTAIFDANQENGVKQFYPGADITMPYTHWTDVVLGGSRQDISGGGTVSPKVLSIVLFRPVAKAELNAKITNAIPNKKFVIDCVNIRPHLIAVPVQGGLFSDITAEKLDTLRNPSLFGIYSDFLVAITDNPLYNAVGSNYSSFEPATITTGSQTVGSAFLYENHHGELYEAGRMADYTSVANYSPGVYYMEINYSIVPEDINAEPSDATHGTCYIPLPKIVRNNYYKVNATFSISLEGSLILEYSVANWTEVKEDLEFTYPTFTITAVATKMEGGQAVPDFRQPVMHYNNNFVYNDNTAPTMVDGAFAFKFKMEESTVHDREWTVHIKEYTQNGNGEWTLDADQTNDFTLAVCNGTDNNIIKETGNNNNYKYTFKPHGTEYQVRVYPKENAGSEKKAAKIYITYPASWLGGQSDELLINTGGGGTLWTNSGGERYAIFIVQENDIPANNA